MHSAGVRIPPSSLSTIRAHRDTPSQWLAVLLALGLSMRVLARLTRNGNAGEGGDSSLLSNKMLLAVAALQFLYALTMKFVFFAGATVTAEDLGVEDR